MKHQLGGLENTNQIIENQASAHQLLWAKCIDGSDWKKAIAKEREEMHTKALQSEVKISQDLEESSKVGRSSGRELYLVSHSAHRQADEPEVTLDEDDDVELPPRKYKILNLVHPNSKMKIVWDLYIGVLIIYSTINVPYQLGFQVTSTGAM